MTKSFGPIQLTLDDNGVANVVFSEASRGNPIDSEFCDAIAGLSIELATEKRVRAVLITAEGKMFSVGGDLRSFRGNLDGLGAMVLKNTASLHAAIMRLQRIDAPVVCAVHGVCAGGMVSIVAGCDLLLASDRAKFIAAYAAIGFSCDAGASVLLSRRMGFARSRRYLLMNETLDAVEAKNTGLVDEVVPHAELLTRASSVIAELSNGPTRAFGEMRRLLLSAEQHSLETQLELEAQALAQLVAGSDAREGVTAFNEKRRPVFQGH